MIAAEIKTEDMPLEELNKRMKWCTKKFGPQAEFRDTVDDSRPWMCMYVGYNFGFWWYFAREEYATLFVLKWS
jgi:hypothetical protein